MATFTEKQRNGLIKKFHVLLGKNGMGNDEKDALLAGYGVESTKDLNVAELVEICEILDRKANPTFYVEDIWRKRVIASIGGYLRAMEKEENIEMIKAIACRAAQKERFNDISLERLKSIYNAFKNRKKDILFAESIKDINLIHKN
jgi:hypothetical protein